jgi:predicted amidohydrolase YtcJ
LGELDTLLATGLATGFGTDWLRIGALKIFVDGAGPSAATYRADQPGLLMRTGDALSSEVLRAHRAGWQLWIHAIGDRAQDLALDAIEAALAEVPRPDARHRVEHLGNAWREPALDRAGRLGVIPVPTAAFMWLVPDATARSTGGPPLYPFRTLLDRGFRPPGNADTAGTQTFAINPMFSLACLVLRTNWNGTPVSPEQAVSVSEALRIHTLYAAYAGFEEKDKGSVEPGKLADLAVLSEDPLTTAPQGLSRIRVDATVIDGRLAYERDLGAP